MAGLTHEQIEALFGQHRMGPKVFKHFARIKKEFEDLTHRVKDLVPGCPMQTIAIRKLVEAKNEATLGYLTYVVEHPEEFPGGIITDEMIQAELQEGKDYASSIDLEGDVLGVCIGALMDKFGSPKATRIFQAALRES